MREEFKENSTFLKNMLKSATLEKDMIIPFPLYKKFILIICIHLLFYIVFDQTHKQVQR